MYCGLQLCILHATVASTLQLSVQRCLCLLFLILYHYIINNNYKQYVYVTFTAPGVRY